MVPHYFGRYAAYTVWPPMAWQVEGLSNNESCIRGNYRTDGTQAFWRHNIRHLPGVVDDAEPVVQPGKDAGSSIPTQSSKGPATTEKKRVEAVPVRGESPAAAAPVRTPSPADLTTKALRDRGGRAILLLYWELAGEGNLVGDEPAASMAFVEYGVRLPEPVDVANPPVGVFMPGWQSWRETDFDQGKVRIYCEWEAVEVRPGVVHFAGHGKADPAYTNWLDRCVRPSGKRELECTNHPNFHE